MDRGNETYDQGNKAAGAVHAWNTQNSLVRGEPARHQAPPLKVSGPDPLANRQWKKAAASVCLRRRNARRVTP